MGNVFSTKELSPQQYADLYGCTVQYIHRQLHNGVSLPHVVDIKKFSRFYVLLVPTYLTKKNFHK
jgi:hypothetical protein